MLRRAAAAVSIAAVAITAVGSMAACGSPAAPSSLAKTSVVVDTDMSWDDIAAIAYLLARDDVDVKAIAIAGDGLTHCDPGFVHMRQLVAALGHAPVAVGCGRAVPLGGSASFPEGWRQHADAFFGLKLAPVADQPQAPTAVGVMTDALNASAKTTIVELGPMTNLAETLGRSPGLKSRVDHVFAMAGAIDVPGNEITYGRAEWNVFIDPSAATTVLDSGLDVTLVPLDATDDAPVTVFVRDAMLAAPATKTTDVLRTLFNDPYYFAGDQYFWDPAAAVVASVPAVAQTKAMHVAIGQGDGADRGVTSAGGEGPRIDVVKNVDASGFYNEYLRTVTGDPKVSVTTPDNRLDVLWSSAGWSVHDSTRAVTGPMAVTLTNDTAQTVYVVVARVAGGHTVADVDALIGGGVVTAVPSWITIVLDVTTPRGHPATWGVNLESGLYVVVGGAENIPLHRLATLQVP